MLLGPIPLTPGSLWRHLVGETPETLQGRTQASHPPLPSPRRMSFHAGGGVATLATKSRLMKLPPGLITMLPDRSTSSIQKGMSGLNNAGAGGHATCLNPSPLRLRQC